VKVKPNDPLLVNKRATEYGASVFGSPLEFNLSIPLPGKQEVEAAGKVLVTFSVLPVVEWHALSNEEKRDRGITKGAGMSIVRASREVDHGWWFFGDKRKENYDDWWRCELRFEPTLDEVFGITHTKQQIRPVADLVSALTPDIEATAKALNRQVRQAHEALKFASAARPAETIAGARERLLPALSTRVPASETQQFDRLAKTHPVLNEPTEADSSHPKYTLIADSLKTARMFQASRTNGKVVIVLNNEHAFYRRVYLPLSESNEPGLQRLKQQIDLVLLSAARAECMGKPNAQEFLTNWSDVLNAFLS
jgi:hypothetical protein